MSTETLEQRLSAVEIAIAQLKQQSSSQSANWLEQITGSFKDDPIFDEVLAYGREFRHSDSPKGDTQSSRFYQGAGISD